MLLRYCPGLAIVVTCFVSSPVLAQPLLQASVLAGVDTTDNATLVSTDEQRQTVLRLEPEIGIADTGADTSYRLTYRFQNHNYKPDSKRNKNSHFVDAYATRSLLDDRIQASAGYAVSQIRNTLATTNVNGIAGNSGYQEAQLWQSSVLFDTPRNRYFDFESHVDGQMSVLEDQKSNSESFGAGIDLQSGYGLDRSYWMLSGSGRVLDGNSQQNALNNQANAVTATHVASDIFVRLQGAYEFVETGKVAEKGEEFKSAGAGLEWRPSRRSHFGAAYNWVPEDQGDDFISGDYAWQPSARLSTEGSYTKRFYGDAYNFQAKHATKHTSTLLSYSETVNNFAFAAVSNVQLLLICPNSVRATLSDCRIPTSDQDKPKAGESLVGVPVVVNDIVDGVKLVKQASISSAYQQGKSTYTLGFASLRRSDVVETAGAIVRQHGVDFAWNILLTSVANLGLTATFTDVTEKTGGQNTLAYTDRLYGTHLVYQVNAHTSVTARYAHLYRDDKTNEDYRENSVSTAIVVKF